MKRFILVIMKLAPTFVLVAFILAMQTAAQTPSEIAAIWDNEHISGKFPSNIRHADLLREIEKLKALGVTINEVGKSQAGRGIFQAEFGHGPLRIFMWSQMHGDEPTATTALVDMLFILAKNRDREWVKKIEEKITLRIVPMLNPDGAELYIRRNLQGIDINRDAINLKTPEARLLKKLRDEWQPTIGFNLHNQNELTAVGATGKQAAISFLVVYGDADKTTNQPLERNKRIVSVMIEALQQFIPGHIARYADEWTPTAFGDTFSANGTPTILIETGALHGRDELFLVKMNFIALLIALRSIADGSEEKQTPANYETLPHNASGKLAHFIFRNANIIDRRQPGTAAVTDIAINLVRRREEFSSPGYVVQTADVSFLAGLEEYDASGFFVAGRFQPIRPGNLGELLFYKKERKIDWTSDELETAYPPDAVFSLGKWIKGEGIVPKK